nr:hypothetical protein [Bacillus sp. JCM 19034]
MQRNFKKKAVAINALKETPISLEEAKEAFKIGFERGLDIQLEPYTLTAEENAYVQKIASERYELDEWNYRK